jgi:hypothetical protein
MKEKMLAIGGDRTFSGQIKIQQLAIHRYIDWPK